MEIYDSLEKLDNPALDAQQPDTVESPENSYPMNTDQDDFQDAPEDVTTVSDQ